MKIFVKVLDGELMTFDVPQNDTVRAFKTLIHQKSGIPVEDQRITFFGRHLEDDNASLSGYGIHDNVTVHLMRRVR